MIASISEKAGSQLELALNAFPGTDASSWRLYRAPGRVNLIGEHTDYNDGFVMPVAINFSTFVAIAPRDDRQVHIYSHHFGERVEYDLGLVGSPLMGPRKAWSDYVWGVIEMLTASGSRFRGANLWISSEVPIGAGLSSSAALEVATGFAMLDSQGFPVNRTELARACRRAENEFVGVQCGIMDQFVSANGKAGHALLLDCKTLEYRPLRLPENVKLVVCNTMVQHSLASSEYNVRRAECTEAVSILSEFLPAVSSLRDVSLEDFDAHSTYLHDVIWRRAFHVITENARVLFAADALEQGDLETFGDIMQDSHRSLSSNFEVSCVELEVLWHLTSVVRGVYGSKMTGGGFGGSTISLVEDDYVVGFVRVVARAYELALGRRPEIYVFAAADGADRVYL